MILEGRARDEAIVSYEADEYIHAIISYKLHPNIIRMECNDAMAYKKAWEYVKDPIYGTVEEALSKFVMDYSEAIKRGMTGTEEEKRRFEHGSNYKIFQSYKEAGENLLEILAASK